MEGWCLRLSDTKTVTVTSILENIASSFCDGYCKYSHQPIPEGKTEDWLFESEESPCNNCPLNFI